MTDLITTSYREFEINEMREIVYKFESSLGTTSPAVLLITEDKRLETFGCSIGFLWVG